VLLKDAHPGYISWGEYERIEHRLQESAKAIGFERGRSPREGPALLQGRAVCGLCGSKMQVGYYSRGGQQVPKYVCIGRGRGFADPMCQSMLGIEIDAAIGALLVDAVTPMALEMALAVQQEIRTRIEEADHLRHRQVERAQYEADRARHRYMQVDPANRLVADSLEADWNAALRALAKTQDEYEHPPASAERRGIDDEEKQRILALATDFPAVWRDLDTPQRDRKRMLSLLIEDVTLIKQHKITAHVRFRGGASTTLTLARPLTAQQLRATHEDVRREIDVLLDEYTDAQVAHILNERGLRTGAGVEFDSISVQWIRTSTKLKSLKERLLASGMVTGKAVEAQLGIRRTTLSRLRRSGTIKAAICNEQGEWLYWPPKTPEPTTPPPAADAGPGSKGRPTARGAV